MDCVDRYRDDFLNLIKSYQINLIFGNKMEMMSLLEVKNEIDLIKKMKELSGFVERLVMTSGKNGSEDRSRWFQPRNFKFRSIFD